MWNEALALSQTEAFKGYEEYLATNHEKIQKIYDAVDADKGLLPDQWGNVHSFQKLCFLCTIWLDLLNNGVVSFVAKKIGQKFVEPLLSTS